MKVKLLILFFITSTLSYSQVSLVKDIEPGPAWGDPQNLSFFYNGAEKLIFSAETGLNGRELWISNDGTSAQTFLLSDINVDVGVGGDPENFVLENTQMYFFANDGVTGKEVWKTNSAFANIHQDYHDGFQGSDPTEMVNGDFSKVFVACNPLIGSTAFGTEVINIIAGTVTEIAAGSLNGEPENLYYENLNGNLYFSGNDQTGTGKELYVWSGFATPASMLVDLNSGGDSNPNHFINLNDKIYFSANGGSVGNELYELDYVNGNQVTLVKDINSLGSGSSDPGEKIIFNNKIYFVARSVLQGRELWESDGTNAGTQLVLDLNPGTAGSFPDNFTIYNNRLYFTATTPGIGLELFYVTAAGNIVLASNIASGGADSNPQDLTVYNGKLYFSADDGINGRELWETAGTSFTTVLTANINSTASSEPRELVVVDDVLFFSANDGLIGRELWKYRDPTLSNSNEELEFTLQMYPNPTQGGFVIDSNQEIITVKVFDIHGKLMKTYTEDKSIYYINELASGVYFINIETSRGGTTRKMIKS